MSRRRAFDKDRTAARPQSRPGRHWPRIGQQVGLGLGRSGLDPERLAVARDHDLRDGEAFRVARPAAG
jgi:hypothetical protein